MDYFVAEDIAVDTEVLLTSRALIPGRFGRTFCAFLSRTFFTGAVDRIDFASSGRKWRLATKTLGTAFRLCARP